MADKRNPIIHKAVTDPAFRQALLADPNAAIAKELGVPVPDGINVVVVEDTRNLVHLVLPVSQGDRPLTDDELEAVAGGTCNWNWTESGCTF